MCDTLNVNKKLTRLCKKRATLIRQKGQITNIQKCYLLFYVMYVYAVAKGKVRQAAKIK